MKKFKKCLCLVFAMMLVASTALAGCSKKSGETTTTPDNTKTPDATKEAEATPDTPAEKEKITVAIYDRGGLDPAEGTMEDNRWTKWINENCPVEVEFINIPRWTSVEKYNALFASDSAPDLILNWGIADTSNWVSDELLMPIEDVINKSSTEYKALLEKYPAMRKMGSVDGELYYFCALNNLDVNHTLTVRKDWMEKLNLDVPKTAEDFYNMAVAFTTQDPDGNGKDDTYGMALSFVSGMIIDQMYGLQNDGFVVENGEMKFAWDRYEACTAMKKKLFDAGCVDPDFAADTTGEKSMQDFLNGKLGMVGVNNGATSGSAKSTYTQLKANVPGAEVMVIPLPTTEIGSFGACLGGGASPAGAINANCKNPGAVMKYIDWLNSSVDVYETLAYGGEEYATKDSNGVWVPKDADKSAKEVSYAMDFTMLCSKLPFDLVAYKTMNPNDEADAMMLELYKQANKAYLNDSYEYQQGYGLPRPALDANLSIIKTNTFSALKDNWTKAVVSGSSYTIENVMADNKKIVADGNGAQLEDFLKDWYAKNKDKLMTDKDFYQLKVEMK